MRSDQRHAIDPRADGHGSSVVYLPNQSRRRALRNRSGIRRELDNTRGGSRRYLHGNTARGASSGVRSSDGVTGGGRRRNDERTVRRNAADAGAHRHRCGIHRGVNDGCGLTLNDIHRSGRASQDLNLRARNHNRRRGGLRTGGVGSGQSICCSYCRRYAESSIRRIHRPDAADFDDGSIQHAVGQLRRLAGLNTGRIGVEEQDLNCPPPK